MDFYYWRCSKIHDVDIFIKSKSFNRTSHYLLYAYIYVTQVILELCSLTKEKIYILGLCFLTNEDIFRDK